MTACSISQFAMIGRCRPQRLPQIGNQNNGPTSVFGNGNKVNSPTIIINNGPGAGSVNSNNGCCGRQQNGIMQMMASMMAMMMQMFSQLLGGQQDCMGGQGLLFGQQGLQGLDLMC